MYKDMDIDMIIIPDIKRKWEGEIYSSTFYSQIAGKNRQFWVKVPATFEGPSVKFKTELRVGVEFYNV